MNKIAIKIKILSLLLIIPALSFGTGIDYAAALKAAQGKMTAVQTVQGDVQSAQQVMSKGKEWAGKAKKLSPMLKKLSYIPHVYLAGYGGYDGWAVLGKIDILAPVLARYDRVVFLYGQGRYGYDSGDWGKNPWTGTLGLGYRQRAWNAVVLGGYVLGDYSNTATGHTIMTISPGLEVLGRNWDFRWNGYFPIGTTSWSQTDWADKFGDYSYLDPSGHKRYDAKFTYYEETGMGTDLEVGRKLFKLHNVLVKGYLNGFFYNMKDNSKTFKGDSRTRDNSKLKSNTPIFGGGVRITIQPTTYLKFSLNDSYDNHQGNVFMAGAQVSIYDIFSHQSKIVDENDLKQRLFDPIERNFGAIGSGNTARETGGPNDPKATYTIDHWQKDPTGKPPPPKYEENDDAWYFSPNTTDNLGNRIKGEKGTFENPFTPDDFTSDTVNTIENYNKTHHPTDPTQLYFVGGGQPYHSFNHVDFPASFEIYGMKSGFKIPATGAERPLFLGSFGLTSGDSLNDIRLQNDVNNLTLNPAITVNNAANTVTISDVDINGYATGIHMDNSNVDIKKSTIMAYNDEGLDSKGALNVTGIEMTNGGDLAVESSTISSVSKDNTGKDYSGNGYGIHADGSGNNITIDGSVITGEGIGAGNYSGNAYGILIGGVFYQGMNPNSPVANNSVTIKNNSTITGMAHGLATGKYVGNYSNNGYGLLVGYASVDNTSSVAGLQLNVSNNTIDVEDNSVLQGGGATSYNAYGNVIGDNNGYGMLIGYGAVDAAGGLNNLSVYGNNVTVNKSTITGTGENLSGQPIALDNSFNGYGILVGYGYNNNDVSSNASGDVAVDQSVHDNTLIINLNNDANKNISGIGSGDGNYSGNGSGILVGYGFNNLNSQTNTVDTSVNKNTIDISNSTVSGKGTYKANGSTGEHNYSGNAYGVAIGYESANYNDEQNLTATVNTNNLKIDKSTVTGTGNATSAGYPGHNGNGLGLLLGYNDLDFFVDKARTYTNDLSIENNGTVDSNGKIVPLTFTNSTIEGDGTTKTETSFSGNGYGLVIGHVNIDYTEDASEVANSQESFHVNGNKVHLESSTFNASGEMSATTSNSVMFAGRGIGILIGDSYSHIQDNNKSAINSIFQVESNDIEIAGSGKTMIKSDSTNNGTETSYSLDGHNVGYGLLVGYAHYGWNGGTEEYPDISSNTVNIAVPVNGKDSSAIAEFDITSLGAGMNATVGLEMGYNGDGNTGGVKNTMEVHNTTFTTNTDEVNLQYSDGIYMFEGTGNDSNSRNSLDFGKDDDNGNSNKNSFYRKDGHAIITIWGYGAYDAAATSKYRIWDAPSSQTASSVKNNIYGLMHYLNLINWKEETEK